MITDSAVESTAEIQGTIINVSFPRSGHRFLREILSGYFDESFVFYEPYTKKIIEKYHNKSRLRDVNYVKTHDFQLLGRKVLYFKFPKQRRYLIQIRHPLESIASYYEFAQKHGQIQHDNEESWNAFLLKNLKYWKKFCKVWLSRKPGNSLLISYEELCFDTFQSTEKVIKFLSGRTSVDSRRLTKVIHDQEFLQYVGDTQSKKQDTRRLESFKYFNSHEFKQMEQTLLQNYLNPHGIRPLLQ